MQRKWPLLIPLLGLVTGLTVAELYPVSTGSIHLAAILFFLVLTIRTGNRTLHTALTLLFFIVSGIYYMDSLKRGNHPEGGIQTFAGKTKMTVEGIIDSRPVTTPENVRITVKTDMTRKDGVTCHTEGKLLLFMPPGETGLGRGDRIRFSAHITIPRPFGLPGEFDYGRFLMLQGISATARVKSADEILLVRGNDRSSMLGSIDALSGRMSEWIAATLPDIEQSSVLNALLLGDQKLIPENLSKAYTRGGVNHVLSVSGFHVGIIAFFIFQMLLILFSRSEYLLLEFNLKRALLLFSMPVIILYMLLTGASPATARSVIMLGVLLMAICIERENDPLNTLLLAAMTLLIIDPAALFDISFQFSFLALWGIIVMSPLFMTPFRKIEKRWLKKLMRFLVASAAATIVMLLPALFYFNQASLIGILSNILIVPLLGYGALLTGFCALAMLYIFPPAAVLFLKTAGLITAFSNAIVLRVAEFPVATFHDATNLDMFFFILTLLSATFIQRDKLKFAALAILPLFAVIIHLHLSGPSDIGGLELSMLGVGQGESMLIRLPDGRTALLDGGGFLHESATDFGERYLAPALLKIGARRIDTMIMTHSHPDHAGGLPYIAENFEVGRFLEPASGGSGELYDSLRDILEKRGIPVQQLHAGERIELAPGVAIEILSPELGKAPSTADSDKNENSLVFRLKYGKTAALFMADAGFLAEEQIMRDRREISADLLKIGHHGSRHSTSEPFLERVNPSIAIVSAGRDNPFGLPAPETIQRLERRGIKIYRTDRNGTVTIFSDGSEWRCKSLYYDDSF